MSAVVGSLVSYETDSDSDNEKQSNTNPEKSDPDAIAHLLPLKCGKSTSLALLNAAPEVAVKVRCYADLAQFVVKPANVN